jgi:PIN domain nuclease of toxin-antitoxin system
VKLLLDTHVALWAIANKSALSDLARTLIEDPDNEVFVSVAAVWDIAIRHGSARVPSPMPLSGEEALETFRAAGFQIADITSAHVIALESLPPLHRDPFDRILVAQALRTPLRLMTHDPKVAAYSDTIITV